MNIYQVELGKLIKLDKAIQEYKKYNCPNAWDYAKLVKSYKKVYIFSNDLSGISYYNLFRRVGDANKDFYENKLILWTYHSKEISWLLRNSLTENEYYTLLSYYQSLKEKLQLLLNEEDYLQTSPFI